MKIITIKSRIALKVNLFLGGICLIVPLYLSITSFDHQQNAPYNLTDTVKDPLNTRVDSLLHQMTIQEKIEQLSNNGFMTTPGNQRLGVPGFVMDDGPHGVRFEKATSFPTGMAIAATWDKTLAFQTGKSMAEEFWAFGKSQQLAPCIDVTQDPRGGRTAESGGEDPYLIGQIGAQVANGIQSTPVLATIKHFMIEGKQLTRNTRNELFDEKWLMGHYGYNYRKAIQESGAFSVMSSYNVLNGVQAAENKYLLDTVLRERWGFPFFVVSDWGAVHQTENAIKAGNDVCMGSDHYKKDLPALIANGSITINMLDKAVRNVLKAKILAGLTDYYPKGNKALINSPAHQKMALDAARASVVLLKNEHQILPYKSKQKLKIAVIGPNADRGNLNCFGSSETTPPYAVSVLQGIRNRYPEAKISYAEGCDINSSRKDGFAEALKLAAKADVVIFAGGLDETQEGEGYESGHDRSGNSVNLPAIQTQLIQNLFKINNNIIAVIQSGGICAMHQSLPYLKGLVYSFYAGQEAGNAIADVISGRVNPSGKLPQTMPVNDDQLPDWNDNYNDDFGNGYRWFDEKQLKPEFPFGFGLSYSSFQYANLKIKGDLFNAGDPIRVTFEVKNVSSVPGYDIAQLYVSQKSKVRWNPVKELKNFEKVYLKPNEKKTVNLLISAEDLYHWDAEKMGYTVDSGLYTIRVGNSSLYLPLQRHIRLRPSAGTPDLVITRIYTMPRYPKVNQPVSFYALIKNQGNAILHQNEKAKFKLRIGKQAVAIQNCKFELKPGQVKLIGLPGGTWKTSVNGKYRLNAEINLPERKESISNNNLIRSIINVY